ncbi:phosphotransferase [Micromonospora ureilytica]|uniref:phosphotransferase n=1 Tax=Micromonospora ureilytica TaxID=709868 RepID=UPI0018C8F4DB|nr:phosphotransferase [Micromonospora ureilytica]
MGSAAAGNRRARTRQRLVPAGHRAAVPVAGLDLERGSPHRCRCPPRPTSPGQRELRRHRRSVAVAVRQPAEVVCHNDFAPYNMVFTDRRLAGVVDWDTASPGPRSWDLAYLAYRLVPLAHPDNGDAIDSGLGERARRLRLLCDAYGSEHEPARILQVAVHRLHDLAAFTKARADQGQENIRSHVGLYRRDARWITAHADQLGRDVA